jgi:hypothetical protein
MGVVAVEPCCDTAVDLEFAETAFDEIALGIELFVMAVLVFASSFGWNNCLHSFGSDKGSNLVGIITFIGNHGLGRLPRQQRRGALAVSFFSSGQQQT